MPRCSSLSGSSRCRHAGENKENKINVLDDAGF